MIRDPIAALMATIDGALATMDARATQKRQALAEVAQACDAALAEMRARRSKAQESSHV